MKEYIKTIMPMAIPAAMERLLLLMTGIVSVVIIGRIGNAALVVVSMCNTIYDIIQAVFIGLSVGAVIHIARIYSTEKKKSCEKIMYHAIILNIVIGVIFGILFMIFKRNIIGAMFQNLTNEMINAGVGYFNISIWAVPFMGIDIAISSSMRGAGDARTPLIMTIVTNIINIILGTLLVFGFKLGITGVAIAFMISRITGGLMRIGAVCIKNINVRLKLDKLYRVSFKTLKMIASSGFVAMLEQMMLQLGFLGMQLITVHISPISCGAYQIANSVISIVYAVTYGFEVAELTVVGSHLGKKDKKNALGAAYAVLVLTEVVSCLIGILMLVFSKAFLSIFSSDKILIDEGVTILRMLVLMIPLTSAFQGIQGLLKTGGRLVVVLIMNMVCPWLIRIPLAYYLCVINNMGIVGLMLGLCTDYSIRAISCLVELKRKRWMQVSV